MIHLQIPAQAKSLSSCSLNPRVNWLVVDSDEKSSFSSGGEPTPGTFFQGLRTS
jgi:hypothetical protein